MKVAQNMEPIMPKFPFEVFLDEILQEMEQYVDAVFSCLESEFLVMPKVWGLLTIRFSSGDMRL